jgi:hypothetical protein
MDPNANLKELLELAHHLIYETENVEDMDRDALELVAHDAIRMAELLFALDGWIKGGGFLPTEWRRP